MQCVMQCMIVHEWNVRAFFFWILLFFFFIFHYLNDCEMQMSYENAMIGLTNALCNHCASICYWQTPDLDVNFLWMQTKCYASLDFSFPMQMLFTKMQMRNVHMMHMSPFRDAIFMMQMSHAEVEMQSLFMMMLVRTFKLWCKCLLTEMEMRQFSNGYVMVQISLWACNDANALMQT